MKLPRCRARPRGSELTLTPGNPTQVTAILEQKQ